MTQPPALAVGRARSLPRPKTGRGGWGVGGVGRWLSTTALVLAFASGACIAAQTVELVGVLGSPEERYVALRFAPDQPVRWLRVGECYASYDLLAYDAAREVAVVQVGEEQREYVLRRASWPDGVDVFSESGDAAARQLQLQQRAAYQHFFDTGTTPPVTSGLSFPIHIVVPPEFTLPEIAVRLHTTTERLAALNPDFEPAAPGAPKHTVRVR